MESRKISPLNTRTIKDSYAIFLMNLIALEKCEKLIIKIVNLIKNNYLQKDSNDKTIGKIKELLIEFDII